MKLVLEDWFGRIEILLEETFKWYGHCSFNLVISLVLLIPFFPDLMEDIEYNTKMCKKHMMCIRAVIAFMRA